MADQNINEAGVESSSESAESKEARQNEVTELRKTLKGIIDSNLGFDVQVKSEEAELGL